MVHLSSLLLVLCSVFVGFCPASAQTTVTVELTPPPPASVPPTEALRLSISPYELAPFGEEELPHPYSAFDSGERILLEVLGGIGGYLVGALPALGCLDRRFGGSDFFCPLYVGTFNIMLFSGPALLSLAGQVGSFWAAFGGQFWGLGLAYLLLMPIALQDRPPDWIGPASAVAFPVLAITGSILAYEWSID